MAISAVNRSAAPPLSSSLEEEFEKLKTYMHRRDQLAETEAERAALRQSFSDASQAAARFGQVGLAKAFSLGGQFVATYQAMQAAAAAGYTLAPVAAAASAAALLVSMFASMDSDEGDALKQIQEQMHEQFIAISAQIQELSHMIERHHAENLHEFACVRKDLSYLKDTLLRLSKMTREDLYQVRQDFLGRFDQMKDQIERVARGISYSLEELRIYELRVVKDEVENLEARGGMSIEALIGRAAFLERWMHSPPL